MLLKKSLFFLLIIELFVASSFVPEGYADRAEEHIIERSNIEILWSESGASASAVSLSAFQAAVDGYNNLLEQEIIEQGTKLAIADFSLPSDKERFLVLDMIDGEVLYTSLVAHGRNSGEIIATDFSNTHRSYKSSLGFYLTAETYEGKHGYSLRLDGIEPGFNDNARDRNVVIHGANYATYDFIRENERLGRSYGCPSLPPAISADIINCIKEKQVLFVFAENDNYLDNSSILNSAPPNSDEARASK